MHERWLLSAQVSACTRRVGRVAVTDLAVEAPLISPRRPGVWSRCLPLRARADTNHPRHLAGAALQPVAKGFRGQGRVRPAGAGAPEADQRDQRGQPARCLPGVGQLAGPVPGHGRGGGPHEPRQGVEAPAGRAGHRLADGDGRQSDRLAAVGAHARYVFYRTDRLKGSASGAHPD